MHQLDLLHFVELLTNIGAMMEYIPLYFVNVWGTDSGV